MDAEMASWKSTGTYVNAFPPSGANIGSVWHVDFQGQPARGDLGASPIWLDWVVSCRTMLAALGFAPSTADPPLFLHRHFAAAVLHPRVLQRFGFRYSSPQSTPLPTGHSLSAPPLDEFVQPMARQSARGDLAAPPTWLHWVVSCRFSPSTADSSLFLRTTTSLPQFYVLVSFGASGYSSPQSTPLPTGHSLSASTLDESVEPSGPYLELVGCLITSGMGLVLGGRGPVVRTGHAGASWVDDLATHSSCEAEIYAGAMAAQELHWLTYLLTDLGERPRSSLFPYVCNNAMIALCQEH
ncbi:unnamed protein product [Closterium sp. NIES-53]